MANDSKNQKRNFVLQLVALSFSKMADAFASTKVVIPWLMSSLGAPAFIIGLLAPIRESGSMLPQFFIGPWITRFKRRSPIHIAGSVIQGVSMLLIACTAYAFSGTFASIAVLVLLVAFSLGRALCSITTKDVMGSTVDKSLRGRLSGLAVTVSGLAIVGLSATIIAGWIDNDSTTLILITLAAFMWLSAGIAMAGVEEPVSTSNKTTDKQKLAALLKPLKQDKQFLFFVLVRACLMGSGLIAPYIVLLAFQGEPTVKQLGILILVSGIANLCSGYFWGKLTDDDGKRGLIFPGLLTLCVCVAACFTSFLEGPDTLWMSLLFFVLSIAHQGVRIGRSTYVTNMAEGDKRTVYVSTSNTLIAILLIVVGLFGALLAEASLGLVFGFFGLMSLAAVVLTRRLNE